MEELRSTEILDREIEADAQKKAAKIIGDAERQAKSLADEVAGRVSKSAGEKEAIYKDKLSQLEKNAEAYIPLEKERFLVSFYDEQVSKAIDEYLDSIGKEKRMALLENKLSLCKLALSGKKIDVRYFGGLDEKDARKTAEKIFSANDLGSFSQIPFEKSGEEAVKGNSIHEGMIFESVDKSVKIRLTIDEIVRETKDKYSYELASTLFGGRLPE